MPHAVVFKTYYWNEAVEHNYRLARAQSGAADFFIIYDRTHSIEQIPKDIQNKERIFFITEEDALNIGLSKSCQNNLFWYNADYQHSLFSLNYPEYDYVCFIESDVAIFIPIEPILEKMAYRAIDVIYKPQMQPSEMWSHFNTCLGYYDNSSYIHKGLFCISFFSRRAILHTLKRRLNMTMHQKKENLSNWPISEAVMVHEPFLAGMRIVHLEDICQNLLHYDWSPPYIIPELSYMPNTDIVHPLTNLNKNFIEKNFRQDYHSLWSEKEIINGTSRIRARAICDLEVYSRLFNSPHAQYHPDRYIPILRDAIYSLDKYIIEMLNGHNFLFQEQWRIQFPSIEKPSSLLFSNLPNWDENFACIIRPGEKIKINGPFEKKMRLIIGVNTETFLDKFIFEGNPQKQIAPNIISETKYRDMSFYTIELSSIFQYIHIMAIDRLEIFSLRLCNGVWLESIIPLGK